MGPVYGTKVIHDEVPGDTDPLGPANKLVFMTGPSDRHMFPTTTRYQVCTKSPAHQHVAGDQLRGLVGPRLQAGRLSTALIVEGKADTPVYLWINDGNVEIRDAGCPLGA